MLRPSGASAQRIWTLADEAAESALQGILAEHPELISGVSADAATCREFQTAAGPADVVVVDTTGEVTLVECKLATNPQIRREIGGQMFDYASRRWGLDSDEFDAHWRERTGASRFGNEVERGAGAACRRRVKAPRIGPGSCSPGM